MAITTPTQYVPLDQQAFPLASMSGPLDTILKNTNYLWTYHRPAMASVAYMSEFEITGRGATYWIPVLPSADGLVYEYTHKVMVTSAGAFTLTTTVEKYDATNGWQAVQTTNTNLGAVTDQLTTVTQTGTLAADITIIRTTYSANNGAKFTPHHLLVRPTPGAVVSGITPSGFVPYDDGSLAGSGGPVTTEHVNRAQANALTVLRDRAQCVFSWVQEYDSAHLIVRPGLASAMSWQASPPARVGLNGQQGTVMLDVACLASVTRGSNTDTVRLQQVNGAEAVKFNATGAVVRSTLEVNLDDGSSESCCDLEVACKVNDNLAYLNVFAVMAWWKPTT
jgi:hypothetical protein